MRVILMFVEEEEKGFSKEKLFESMSEQLGDLKPTVISRITAYGTFKRIITALVEQLDEIYIVIEHQSYLSQEFTTIVGSKGQNA